MPRSSRFTRWLFAAAAIWVWLAAVPLKAAEKLPALEAALQSITAGELQQHVDFLADDKREGREAGSRGGRAAGDYLIAHVTALHLKGAGTDGGYAQPFAPNFRNLLGLSEGSDPQLKNEVVLVGAHYDHVGYGRRGNGLEQFGFIHNGADDNASGTASVLELAQAFTLLPQPPRRSVLFAFWDAEEKGMLGSKHWVAHPTVPLERVTVMINLDMIGRLRNDRLIVFGSRSGYGLRRVVSSHNEPPPLAIEFRRTVIPMADHYPFYLKEIPVLALHTDLHPQYHTPSDDASLINPDGMQRIVRLLLGVVYDLADRDQPPRFRQAVHGETEENRPVPAPPDQGNGRPLRVGITWRLDDAEPGAVVLTHVVPGSPAARAGLQPEDRIYQVNGRDFSDDAELGTRLKTLPGPIKLLIERGGQLRNVEIDFEAAKLRRAA